MNNNDNSFLLKYFFYQKEVAKRDMIYSSRVLRACNNSIDQHHRNFQPFLQTSPHMHDQVPSAEDTRLDNEDRIRVAGDEINGSGHIAEYDRAVLEREYHENHINCTLFHEDIYRHTRVNIPGQQYQNYLDLLRQRAGLEEGFYNTWKTYVKLVWIGVDIDDVIKNASEGSSGRGGAIQENASASSSTSGASDGGGNANTNNNGSSQNNGNNNNGGSSSIIDDYADPSTEMPSYMDPEDG